jgi:FG-GAP repeat
VRSKMAIVALLSTLGTMLVATEASAAVGVISFGSVNRDGVAMTYGRASVGATPVRGSGATRSDFDGDGVDDVAAYGQPMYYTETPNPSGVVAVRYSSGRYVDYFLGVLGAGGGCDCFGEALATGNFNADGYDDLVIGDMDEVDPGSGIHAGGVWVIPGSADGLRPQDAKHFNQSTSGVPGGAETFDRFGGSLATGDLNGDGRDDLAIGSSGESVSGKADAGSVTVLFGGAFGLSASGAIALHQNLAAVPGSAETHDLFGSSVAIGKVNKDSYADLVIGAPGENDYWDGGGVITLMWGSAAGLSMSGSTTVTGSTVTNTVKLWSTNLYFMGNAVGVTDTNGDGYGEVIAAASAAQVSGTVNGGALVSFVGRASGLSPSGVKVLTQATSGVPGGPENDDRFANSIAVGDVTGDGRGDVLVGIPGEDVGSTADAGAITLLRGSTSGLTGTGAQYLDQNNPAVPGASERGDAFGSSVALLNLNGSGGWDAVVAASTEEVAGDLAGYGTGLITHFYGGSGGLTANVAWSGRSLSNSQLTVTTCGSQLGTPESGYLN